MKQKRDVVLHMRAVIRKATFQPSHIRQDRLADGRSIEAERTKQRIARVSETTY